MNGQIEIELTPERKKIAEDIIQKTNASLEEVIAVFKDLDEMEERAMRILFASRLRPTEFMGLSSYIQTGN